MADQPKQPEKKPETLSEAQAFRRAVALAMLPAYINRHGGFGGVAEEQEMILRQVWGYADAFIALENAAPLPPPQTIAEFSAPLGRRAHPSDEWGVTAPDGRRKKGFITERDAQDFADKTPGAVVKQISGPGAEKLAVAS